MARGIDTYQPKTIPYAHQQRALSVSYRKRAFALFMDPGLGKTKVIIDTAALLYEAGHIRALLILAPNDVDEQWVEEQLPAHLPDRIRTRTVCWGPRVRQQREARELASHPLPDRLHVLAMNHEAMSTKKGRDVCRRLLLALPTLFVLDESHGFKSPRAARTRSTLALAPLAFARRILSGTPTNGVPFELYTQFQFLDPRILGFDSYLAFRHRYGVWSKEYARVVVKGEERLREYEALQGYQNLPELFSRVERAAFTCTKEECTDLPAKMYARVRTRLSVAQREVYERLVDEHLVLLADAEAGRPVRLTHPDELPDDELATRLLDPALRMTLRIKLTLMLRLRQCAAGFVTDDAGRTHMIDGEWERCPRMVKTVEYVEQALAGMPRKVIVWAHFREPLRVLERALQERLGAEAVVRVDGTVKGAQRAEAIARFKQEGSAVRVLVAHPRTMGTGQNLGVASYCVYYTNDYSRIQRKQSEDRIDRIDRRHPCTIVDVVAADAACDAEVLEVQRTGADFTRRLMGMSGKQIEERLRAC